MPAKSAMPQKHRGEADEVFPPGMVLSEDMAMKSRARSVPRRTVAPLSAARPKTNECLVGRTLMAVASRRKELDGTLCQVVFNHLETSLLLQQTLQRVLDEHQLNGLEFGVLVAMLACDPDPVTQVDLIDYTASSRPAVAGAVSRLECSKLVSRTTDPLEGRAYRVHLTAKGRTSADNALMDYLRTAGNLARYVERDDQQQLLAAYSLLQHGAIQVPA
jgi:DNA-binding MarR family transcriptional regulator